jgi:hypothetical protein
MRRLLGIGASVLLVLWLGTALFGSTDDSMDDSQEYWSSRSDVIDLAGWTWADPTREPKPAERITVSWRRPSGCHGDLGQDRQGRWVCRETVLFGESGTEICDEFGRCHRVERTLDWILWNEVRWCQRQYGPWSCDREDDTWFVGGRRSGLDDAYRVTDPLGRDRNGLWGTGMDLWGDQEKRSPLPRFPSSYYDPWNDDSRAHGRWP